MSGGTSTPAATVNDTSAVTSSRPRAHVCTPARSHAHTHMRDYSVVYVEGEHNRSVSSGSSYW